MDLLPVAPALSWSPGLQAPQCVLKRPEEALRALLGVWDATKAPHTNPNCTRSATFIGLDPRLCPHKSVGQYTPHNNAPNVPNPAPQDSTRPGPLFLAISHHFSQFPTISHNFPQFIAISHDFLLFPAILPQLPFACPSPVRVGALGVPCAEVLLLEALGGLGMAPQFSNNFLQLCAIECDLTASGTASQAPSFLMHPWVGGRWLAAGGCPVTSGASPQRLQQSTAVHRTTLGTAHCDVCCVQGGGGAGGWRRLPKRLGVVTVGYKCH